MSFFREDENKDKGIDDFFKLFELFFFKNILIKTISRLRLSPSRLIQAERQEILKSFHPENPNSDGKMQSLSELGCAGFWDGRMREACRSFPFPVS
jgi:hypothetical protein